MATTDKCKDDYLKCEKDAKGDAAKLINCLFQYMHCEFHKTNELVEDLARKLEAKDKPVKP